MRPLISPVVPRPVCTLQCPFSFSNPVFGSVFFNCSPHLQEFGNLYHLKLVAVETGYNFFQLHSKSCWTPRETSAAALFTCFPGPMNLPQESQIIFLFLRNSVRPAPWGAFDWLEKTLKPLSTPFTEWSWNRKLHMGQKNNRHLPKNQREEWKRSIEGYKIGTAS